MRTLKKPIGAGALLLVGLAPAAQAQDISVTVGLKAWNTKWSTWFTQDTVNVDSNTQISGDVFNRTASSEFTFIPALTVRWGDWLVSGSMLAKKEFEFFLSQDGNVDGQLDRLSFERKEYDVNVGYSIAPNAAFTLGWKQLEYKSQNSSYKYKASGATLGFAGSAPLAHGVSMYGNLAYGRPKISDGVSGEPRGDYFLTEVGLAYPLGGMSDMLKSLVLTAGYRYQKLQSDSVTVTTTRFTTGQPLGSREVELIDTTEGFTIGVSGTF